MMGWVVSLPAISGLAHLLGKGDSSASSSVLYPFMAAAMLTLVEFTSEAGTALTSDWMSQWPVLRERSTREDGELTAAQAFEMTFLLSNARTLWLYAMDNLLLAWSLISAALLTWSHRASPFSVYHSYLGCVIAVCCVAEFAFEVTRFINWNVSVNASIITTLLIDAVLFPIWLVWLGGQLRYAQGATYQASLDQQVDLERALNNSIKEQEDLYDGARQDAGYVSPQCATSGTNEPMPPRAAEPSARDAMGIGIGGDEIELAPVDPTELTKI